MQRDLPIRTHIHVIGQRWHLQGTVLASQVANEYRNADSLNVMNSSAAFIVDGDGSGYPIRELAKIVSKLNYGCRGRPSQISSPLAVVETTLALSGTSSYV